MVEDVGGEDIIDAVDLTGVDQLIQCCWAAVLVSRDQLVQDDLRVFELECAAGDHPEASPPKDPTPSA